MILVELHCPVVSWPLHCIGARSFSRVFYAYQIFQYVLHCTTYEYFTSTGTYGTVAVCIVSTYRRDIFIMYNCFWKALRVQPNSDDHVGYCEGYCEVLNIEEPQNNIRKALVVVLQYIVFSSFHIIFRSRCNYCICSVGIANVLLFFRIHVDGCLDASKSRYSDQQSLRSWGQ